jgi:hypothetical protein
MWKYRLLGISLLLVAGCAKIAQEQGMTERVEPSAGRGQTLPGSNLQASGFLRDYSKVLAVPGAQGTWEYVHPAVNWKPYTKILIEPMEVWISPEANYRGIKPDDYKQIEQAFREIVIREFQDGGYELVQTPQPGTLVMHYALTGVNPVRQGLLPSDVLPIKAAITAARYATGTEAQYIAMSGEMEVLDGVTSERLYAAVGARRSYATTIKGEQITMTEWKDIVSYWAKQWRTRLDKARGIGQQ